VGDHWILIVLDYYSWEIHVFDSLGGKNTQAIASVRGWLDQILTPAQHLTQVDHLGVSPRQFNCADCSFWVIANGLAYATGSVTVK
jgi:Ulp1 family protease